MTIKDFLDRITGIDGFKFVPFRTPVFDGAFNIGINVMYHETATINFSQTIVDGWDGSDEDLMRRIGEGEIDTDFALDQMEEVLRVVASSN